jgi:hypothetical protein
MSEIFSFQRFWNLTREHWVRNWRTVMTMALVTSVLIPLFLILGEQSQRYTYQHYNMVQESRFLLLLSFFIAFSSLVWFYNLHSNSSKINYLMMPVSTLEQVVLTLLWNVIILIMFFLIIFYLINKPIYNWAVGYEKVLFDSPDNFNRSYTFEPPALLNPFLLLKQKYLQYFLFGQVAILVCTLIFRKFAIVKTILLGLIFLFMFGYYMSQTNTQSPYIPNWIKVGEFKMVKQLNNEFGEYLMVESPNWLNSWKSISPGIAVFIFWIALYFLLKEKEV